MSGKRLAMVPAIALTALAASVASPPMAQAQTVPTNPVVSTPLRVDPERNGLDLATGNFTISGPVISVPGDPHLTFQRVQDFAPYLVGTIVNAGEEANATFSVHTGSGSSESFICPDYDCTNETRDGATLDGQTFQEAQTNTIYTFDVQVSAASGSNRTAMYYASRAIFTDGEALTYTYATAYYTGAGGMVYPSQRPVKIASNTGYYLTISYQSDDVTNNRYGVPAQVALFSPANSQNPVARLTYGTDGSVTDLAGRVYRCSGCGGAVGAKVEGRVGSLTLPGESVASVATGQGSSSNIFTFNRDGVGWNYNFSNLRTNSETLDYNYSQIIASGPAGYSMTYAIGQAGQHGNYNIVSSQRDALNRTTSFSYDGSMRVTQITYPEGGAAQVTYDDSGNITRKTTKANPNSGLSDLVETNYFDPNCGQFTCNRPVWHRDALNRETDYTYDSQGQMTSEAAPADANGVRRMTYVQYESHDTGNGSISRPTVVRVCGSTTTCGTSSEIRTEYEYWNNTFLPVTKRQIDAASGVTLTTTYSYDNAGRMLSMDGPLPGSDDTVFMRYDVLGRKIWDIGARAADGTHPAKFYTYRDSDDKVVRVQSGWVADPANPSLNETDRTDASYDSRRYDVRDAVSSGGTTYTVADKAYDDRGQLTCSTERLNAAAFGSLPASACTLGTQGNDGPDRITYNSYDAAGQLLKITKAYGTSLQQDYATYTYSADGKQTSLTDARGYLATMTYDGFDRQTQWTFPSPSATGQANGSDYETYGYDSVGNRTSLRKRDGRTIAYGYDGLNRMVSKTYPNGGARAVYYAYDVMGEMTAARFDSASGSDAVTRGYDGLGRVLSSTIAVAGVSRTLTYQYDAGSNRTRITHPDGVYFDMSYDALDRMVHAWWTAPGSNYIPFVAITYDAQGRRININRASSNTAYTYDPISRPATIGQLFAGNNGNVTTSFGYNSASQITTEQRNNDDYAWTGAVNVDRPYAANGLNQYGTAGSAAFGYDADGNLTSDGTTSFGYDIENRLTSTSAGISLVYDPLGRLYQTSGGTYGVTQFLYDGDALVAEFDGQSLAMRRRYMHKPGVDEPILWDEGSAMNCSGTHFLHSDHEGSIIAVADCNGNRQAVDTYDEYGIPGASNYTGSLPQRFQYTGQIWLPELGMYYYKARMFSPTLGRFMQTDPIGYKDQVNLYEYVGDDPVNHTDPSGEETACGKNPCPTLHGHSPTAASVAQAVNKAIRTENSSSTFKTAGASVIVKTAATAQVSVNVKVPVVGSVTVKGTLAPSRAQEKVTIRNVQVSSTVGKVTSAPSQVTIYQNGNNLNYNMNAPLTIEKNLLVTSVNVVNQPAGNYHIP